MGCTSSNPVDDKVNSKEVAIAQRRRLSVAPQHVGDITATAAAKADKQEELRPVVGERKISNTAILSHASLSRKGFIPYNANKVNQDREVVAIGLKNDAGLHLFGVMDGHGEFGHDVSNFCKDWLPVYLEQSALRQDPCAAIKDAVQRLTEGLHKTTINTAFSGTTAVFGVFVDSKLYVANIGDSRCVLCTKVDGTYRAVPMSIDQKPDNPEEKARIIQAGGRVDTLPGMPGEDCGPYRVWLKEVDVPGLAMSRSIGDEVSHTVGVISDPVIQDRTISENDAFVIWASDGVWEFISNEQACAIVTDAVLEGQLDRAAKLLVHEAHDQWHKQEDVVDDITVVIVRFERPKA